MESTKELRVKLQTNVLGNPILQRVLSIYLTRVFLMLNISANQISALMLLVGVVSIIPLLFGFLWTGIFISYLCVLLDASDGEVARYRGVYSLRGIYLDMVNHLLTQPLFFFGLGFAVAQSQRGWMQEVVFVAAALGALTFPIRRANGDLHRVLFVRYYSANPDRYSISEDSSENANGSGYKSETSRSRVSFSYARFIKEAIYHSEYHAVMLVIVASGLLVEKLFLPASVTHPVLSWIIILYATIPILYLAKEVVAGYRHIEGRIVSVKRELASK